MPFLVLIFVSLSLFAQNIKPVEKDPTEIIKLKIAELKVIEGDNFFSKIEKLKKEIGEYIENKKRVCSGEFSTIILGEESLSDGKDNKLLSNEEKMLCYREVQGVEEEYIKTLFFGRINYMKKIHQSELKKLEETKKNLLIKIEKDYAYSVRKFGKKK